MTELPANQRGIKRSASFYNEYPPVQDEDKTEDCDTEELEEDPEEGVPLEEDEACLDMDDTDLVAISDIADIHKRLCAIKASIAKPPQELLALIQDVSELLGSTTEAT